MKVCYGVGSMAPVEFRSRAPLVLWLAAALAALAGVALSPSTLIALGPLSKSLTSDNPLTRQTAELTVLTARVLCLIAAAGLFWMAARWRRVTGSRPMQLVARHEVPSIEVDHSERKIGAASLVAVCVGVLGCAYLLVIEKMLSPSVQGLLGRESGVFEQGTALAFFCAALVGAVAIVRERRYARSHEGPLRGVLHRKLVWLGLLVAFFFLCFGEELSWGQHYFGFSTPESMSKINVQNETNLHNMMGYLADHLFILGVLVYGAVLPILAATSDFWRRALHWVGLPLASEGLAIGFLIASLMHDFVFVRIMSVPPALRVAELRELVTGVCFLLMMVEQLRMSKSRATADDLAPSSVPVPAE